MTQYNTLKLKLSNSQFNKLRAGRKKKWYLSNFKSVIKCDW